MTEGPAIVVTDLVKRFGDKTVVDHVSLRITSYNVCYTKLLRIEPTHARCQLIAEGDDKTPVV